MVLNAAVQMLREADELKEKISKFKSGTSMLQERSLWATQQQLQKIYQKVLVLDLDYALDKKVEQDLWNMGFKQQIEALQSISKDKKNPLRSEGQAMLSWVLQAAAGFYLCLLHQICTTFQLDLPFRRRASLLGWVEGWGAGEAAGAARLPAPAAARYICQHCLVHLGDLARYRQQLRHAHAFYRHALVVSVHSGQPYNQLALVAWRRGRRLAALYWHVRSLLVRAPFPPAPANLSRTLNCARQNDAHDKKDLPVLPGVMVTSAARDSVTPAAPTRLDAHSYVTELIRALHYIHTGDELETAATLVNSLNSSLTTLIATDSFESMTLIKMACVLIWIIQSTTDELSLEGSAVTAGEATAARLSCSLGGGALLALLLPSYAAEAPPERALPAGQSTTEEPRLEGGAVTAGEATAARLSCSLGGGALLALLLPSYAAEAPPERALPAGQSTTEEPRLEGGAVTAGEATAARLSCSLGGGALLALLLPSYAAEAPPERALPAGQSTTEQPSLEGGAVTAGEATAARLSCSLGGGALLALLLPSYAAEAPPERALPAGQSTTEEPSLEGGAVTAGEATAARLSCSLGGGALLALLLPSYAAEAPPERALPAGQSTTEQPSLEGGAVTAGEATAARLSCSLGGGALLALLLPSYAAEAPPERALPAGQSTTEQPSLEGGAVTAGEATAARLSCSLGGGALLALLLPSYAAEAPPERALPAVKVWLEWAVAHPAILDTSAWTSKPALWPALAHTLNALADSAERKEAYATVPLPEDEELHGFLPLEACLQALRFPNHAAWDTYGARVPKLDTVDTESPPEVPTCLLEEPELQKRVRAHRLVQLGRRLAELRPDHFSFTEEDSRITFTAASVGGEQLSLALAALSAARGPGVPGDDSEGDSDDDGPTLKPPVVISEADFREKVREKRAGILKPQGSLERAREERAMATQDDPEECDEDASRGEDKRESRKQRVNIAMAAIMRKQEETNKQVKFVTPPPTTPESTADTTESKEEKPKVIQPKVMKSLTNLPIGRKTGGILSLKDKSAGYPHLVNTEPEQKKSDKEEKKEPKLSQGSSQQNFQQKRPEPPSPTWGAGMPPQQTFAEGPRMTFQKNYGIQNTGLSYNPSYQQNINNQGIRLPVVNPKEIDVRTAALQKQSSRQELFQEGHKFNTNYQISGDKKNFLNDLPPRFANQYRYWQAAQENQFNDNKFRDDSFKSNSNVNSNLFNQQPRSSWMNQQPIPETYQQQANWWKPENQSPSFNYSAPPMNLQPNYFAPLNSNLPNPYQNLPSYNQMPNNMGQKETANPLNQPYIPSTIGQPMQTLQSLVSSPNFNSSLNSFSSYPPAVTYDSSMYPQFNNKLGFQPMPMKPPNYQGSKDLMDLGIGFGNNAVDMQQRNLNFSEPKSDDRTNLEHKKVGEGAGADVSSNTYSLFSGAPGAASWGPAHTHPPQSLWSGPGPSPLERLLEQQKQLKPPAPH